MRWWWPCDCFQIAGWCHSPASWKQTNISFQISRSQISDLKTDNVDYLKKPPWKFFFFYIFAIHSSSRYEKRCQMSLRLFSLFQGSRNQQCKVLASLHQLLKFMLYGNFPLQKMPFGYSLAFYKFSFARECFWTLSGKAKFLVCKLIFFPISAFAIIKEIASG